MMPATAWTSATRAIRVGPRAPAISDPRSSSERQPSRTIRSSARRRAGSARTSISAIRLLAYALLRAGSDLARAQLRAGCGAGAAGTSTHPCGIGDPEPTGHSDQSEWSPIARRLARPRRSDACRGERAPSCSAVLPASPSLTSQTSACCARATATRSPSLLPAATGPAPSRTRTPATAGAPSPWT
jgi:hypothetical protein